jgi:N6-adenosine-specific RNA methylase IME4
MSQPRELILLTNAQRALAKACSVDEVKELRDKAEAVKAYAKKARLGKDIVMEASVIKVRAERKLGEILQSLDLAKASPGNQHSGRRPNPVDGKPIFLSDLGVTKSDSSRAQQIASLPDSVFERYIAGSVQARREPTTAAFLRLVKERRTVAKHSHPLAAGGGMVSALAKPVQAGRKFATIYSDPPWPYRNQGTRAATDNHYPTMTVEELCAEPVRDLCDEDAHLHLWTTNGFLREAFDVLQAWGFTYKSCFIWVKPELGIGNYWRVSHEFLLFGVRGNLPFQDKGQRSWLECDRTGHGRTPTAIRELVEKVSPGPYLEMYGRDEPPNPAWTVHGNQIEQHLPLFPAEEKP